MTFSTRQISLKNPAFTAALLLASASVFAQQAATPQSDSDAPKKHPAGVKYQPITAKGANPTSPTAQASTTAAQAADRKSGAIMHADYDKRQDGAPLKGVGTAGRAEGDTTADKEIGSAGMPGKAASANDKTAGVPLKGCPKCATADESQKQAAKSAKTK